MKNLILSAFLAAAVVSSAFASGENKISSVVLNSFNIDFKNVSNVSWTANTGYAKAAFTQDNRKMEVFYNETGNIVAISKSIQLDELPVNAKRIFARKYQDYTVKEAIQFDGTNEQAYYISAENDKENVILKVDDSHQLSLFKKSKK